MGKSNRIKSEKAERAAKVSLVNTKKKKKGAPSWLYTLIISIVAVFVLVTIVVSTITSSGMLLRMQKAVYSENFTVNGQMLTYMFKAQYEQFQQENQSNLTYFSLDTKKSLKDQKFGDTTAGYGYETMFLGAFEGTWYDYFMNQVKEQAVQMLIYCEEAKTRGIELDEAEIAEIDSSISTMESMASIYGSTVNAYIASTYGKGVKLKDVRATMEMSALATKCAEIIGEELRGNITDKDIDKKYNENKKDYNVFDYVSYNVNIKFTDVAKDVIDGYDGKATLTSEQEATVLAEYKKRIEEAKAEVKTFKDYKTADEFFDAVLNNVANKAFDKYYKSESLKDADKLSEDALKAVKKAMVKKVVEEVKTKATSSDDTSKKDNKFVAYGQEMTENASKAIDSVKSKVYTDVNSANTKQKLEKVKYNESDELSKWAFEDGRKVGDMKEISDGDGANSNDIKNKEGFFDISLYMISKTQRSDETLARDVAYMTFSTEKAAKDAIDAFKKSGKFTKEGLEAIAKSKNAATNGLLENCLEGQITYNGFDAWLYADGRKIGDYTETALANAASEATEYAVFCYVADGEAAWYIDVKNSIYSENYEALYEGLKTKYAVTVKTNVLSKVDA